MYNYNMFRIGAEIFGNHKVRIQNFKARRQALQKKASSKQYGDIENL